MQVSKCEYFQIVIVWPDLAMYDLNEFFSGDVSLDEFVVGHHFDALTQDFCSDFDIYEAQKNNLNFHGDPLRVNPSEIGSKEDIFDAEVLLQTLEEDGPSLGPEYDSVVEVDTTETETLVEMFDVHSKPEIVGEMLRFIYTGDIPNEKLDALASDLLGTSDKHELNYLKKICEDKLCSTLKVYISIECLVLGDLHNASKLKKMALELVAKNMSKIVETDVKCLAIKCARR
mgnify:CR=1 FL=1